VSHLVPVKKMDKNGKIVTRHMKPEKVGNGAEWLKGLTPKPVARERERIIRDCGDFLLDGENEVSLEQLTDKELADVGVIVSKIELDSDFKRLRELLNPAKTFRTQGFVPPPLGEDLDGLARYNRLDDGIPIDRVLGLTRGLRHYRYGGLGEKTNKALIDTSLAVLEVLNRGTSGFLHPDEVSKEGEIPEDLDNYHSFFGNDTYNGQLWIRNRKFVALVIRRSDRADDIINLIETRGLIQPEPIEAILDFDSHSSLKDGAL
jgi:hypothetical protein